MSSGSGYPKGGLYTPARPMKPATLKERRIRNKIVPHVGASIDQVTLEKCSCGGSGLDESTKEVDGYRLREGNYGFGDVHLTLCRPCAVKLALKILELESL